MLIAKASNGLVFTTKECLIHKTLDRRDSRLEQAF